MRNLGLSLIRFTHLAEFLCTGPAAGFFRPRPPGAALAVDRAFSSDGDVMQIAAAKQAGIVDAFGAFPRENDGIVGRLGGEQKHRVFVQMNADLRSQLNGAGEIFTGLELHHAAARFRQPQRGVDGLAVVGLAITLCAEFRDVELLVGDLRQRNLSRQGLRHKSDGDDEK